MGFDTSLFSQQPVDENMVCHICHEVMDRPTMICENGHTYCQECALKWSQQHLDCPECKRPIREQTLVRPLQNMILNLRVACPEIVELCVVDVEDDDTDTRKAKCAKLEGQRDVGGGGATTRTKQQPPQQQQQRGLSTTTCDWKGTLADYLKKHLLYECQYRQVQCGLGKDTAVNGGGCKCMVRVCDLQAHQKDECAHRLVTCNLCNAQLKQLALHDHRATECPQVLSRCPYCGEKMIRNLLGRKPTGIAVDDAPVKFLGGAAAALDDGDDNHCASTSASSTSSSSRKYTGHYATCPKLRVKCEFHQQGCHYKLKREDLGKHHQDFARVHAKLVADEINNIRKDRDWSFKELFWRIPYDVLQEIFEEPDLLFVEESQRVKVGDYHAFLRLIIDQGIVSVRACVDRPPFSPSIDCLEIEEENGKACLDMEEEQLMVKDAGEGRTWSVGGPLRCTTSNEDESSSSAKAREVSPCELVEWAAGGGDLVLRASFRLKGPESVMVECKR